MPPKRQVQKGGGPRQNVKPGSGGGRTGGGGGAGAGVRTIEDNKAAQEKFAVELRWCVSQLEAAILEKKKKGSAKQNEDLLRSHKTLTSSKAPMVKKRQVMNALFGDYRSKMAQEEKKIKMQPPKIKTSSAVPDKSVFLKKCVNRDVEAGATNANDDRTPQQDGNSTTMTSPAEEENINNQTELPGIVEGLQSNLATSLTIDSDVAIANSNASDTVQNVIPSVQPNTQGFKFVQSQNTFRFNFSTPS